MPANLILKPPRFQPSKIQPKKPSIIIPPTPVNVVSHASQWYFGKTAKDCLETQSSFMTLASIQSATVVASDTPQHEIHNNCERMKDDDFLEFKEKGSPFSADLSASAIASPEIMAIAQVFAATKRNLIKLSDSFDLLGGQTEKMVALGNDIKTAEQLNELRLEVDKHITMQRARMKETQNLLETKVKEALEYRIRERVCSLARDFIGNKVEEKVRKELQAQIPDKLRNSAHNHERQILDIQSDLHNLEARRFNATLESTTIPLRPLLRPLPTPEQSPAYVISRSMSYGTSAYNSPVSAFPLRVPVPTPIALLNNTTRGSYTLEPPTPSSLFPRDLRTLFSLGPEAAKTLLQEYGLNNEESAIPSPISATPIPKVVPQMLSTSSIKTSGSITDLDSDDINKFMNHIGVPFLMIPAPKPKDTQQPSTNSTINTCSTF